MTSSPIGPPQLPEQGHQGHCGPPANTLAIVTGGSAGIGFAIAQAFATCGVQLIMVGRDARRLQQAKDKIGGVIDIVQADLGDIAAAERVSAAIRPDVPGPGRLLVLVNNAGEDYTQDALDVTPSDWDNIFDVHVRGGYFLAQSVGRLMIAEGRGRIINLSSTWAKTTGAGKSVYGAAKAAVSYLTAALSTEWAASGVRVNAIAPTATMTETTRLALQANPARYAMLQSRIPAGRPAMPADVAGAAMFLASPASDFITGQTLYVDGGWTGQGPTV